MIMYESAISEDSTETNHDHTSCCRLACNPVLFLNPTALYLVIDLHQARQEQAVQGKESAQACSSLQLSEMRFSYDLVLKHF